MGTILYLPEDITFEGSSILPVFLPYSLYEEPDYLDFGNMLTESRQRPDQVAVALSGKIGFGRLDIHPHKRYWDAGKIKKYCGRKYSYNAAAQRKKVGTRAFSRVKKEVIVERLRAEAIKDLQEAA